MGIFDEDEIVTRIDCNKFQIFGTYVKLCQKGTAGQNFIGDLDST